MGEDKSVAECYQYNSDTRLMVEKLEDQLIREIGEIKDKLVNRLPVWVTFYISFLTLLVGALMAKVVFH